MDKFFQYAKDIMLLLKYNNHLKNDDKILAIQLRLMQMYEQLKESEIKTSDYTNILPKELLNNKIFNN